MGVCTLSPYTYATGCVPTASGRGTGHDQVHLRGVSCQTGINLRTELRSSCSASVLSVIRLRIVCS
jgi:hypothetical protein